MEFLRKIGLAQIFNTRLVNANKSKGSSSSSLKVEPNTDAGGEDFYDARAAMSDDDNDSNISSPDHLVIMVNGLVGSKADWKFAAEQFVKRLPDKVIVHRSESNSAKSTFDGIDVMGERLAQEVRTVACQWPELQKISFVAHSLGGLIARYSIGKLYECDSTTEPMSHNGDHLTDKPEKQPNEAKIAGLDPINFITVATPHLGSRGHKQIDTLLACGGLAKNPVFVQEQADIIGCPIILPRENESVLLGAAILGAVAAKKYAGVKGAMKALNAAGQVIYPDTKVKKYHDAKYHIFRDLYNQQLSQRSIMDQSLE